MQQWDLLIDETADLLATSSGDDFEDLDKRFLVALRGRYSESLSAIFERVGADPLRFCAKIDNYRAERHVLPVLHVGNALGLPSNQVEDFACVFVCGFSLPVLAVNHSLDDRFQIQARGVSNLVLSTYTSAELLATLPNSAHAAAILNGIYRRAIPEAIIEHQRRWCIPSLAYCRRVVRDTNDLSTTRFYRSNCDYLTAVLRGLTAIAGIEPTPFVPIGRAFGIVRQLADEVADVANDISKGLITYSLISIFGDDIAELIRRCWAGTEPIATLTSDTRVVNGIDNALDTTELWQSAAENQCTRLGEELPAVRALRPFVAWKRGVLARLRADPHAPHFGDYRHLPTLDAIESVTTPVDEHPPQLDMSHSGPDVALHA